MKAPGKSDTEATLKRDDNTCRYCGFQSAQFQRVVPTADGFVTACIFCEQVRFLERAGQIGGGFMIWLPEIGQAELNHIARAIYVAQAAGEEAGPLAAGAKAAWDALMKRRGEARKRLGFTTYDSDKKHATEADRKPIGADEPMLLSTVLVEQLSPSERAAAIKKLDGIRFMPLAKYVTRGKNGGDSDSFPQMVKFWRSPQGPYAKLPTKDWQDLFDKLVA